MRPRLPQADREIGHNAQAADRVQSAVPVLSDLRSAFIAAAQAGHASPACREMAGFLRRYADPAPAPAPALYAEERSE